MVKYVNDDRKSLESRNGDSFEIIVTSQASLLTGATSAISVNDKLYGGSFGDDLLVCDLPLSD